MNTNLKLSIPSEGLWEYVIAVRPEIERALLHHLPKAPSGMYKFFNNSLHYALFPGGKRLRPVLAMLGAEVVGGRAQDVLHAAVAVEYLHTSSLIFDDLPCMDDAAERRGRASLHVRYGEGLAVLIALALMNSSYGLVLESASARELDKLRAHRELIEGIGVGGMIAGQYLDVAAGTTLIPVDDGFDRFNAARNYKTSALIRLALRIGAILSGAEQRQLDVLLRFAYLLGDAYQTSDDVLDVKEDMALCGHGVARPTIAIELSVKDARQRIESLITEAKDLLLMEFGRTRATLLLCEMADYIAERKA